MQPRARAVFYSSALIFLAISVAFSAQKVREQEREWKVADLARNSLFLHCERLQAASAQAAMDAILAPSTPEFLADYHQERMQVQANWIGMERLAASDARHQGQVTEIRGSIADLLVTLDPVAVSSNSAASSDLDRVQGALHRAQTALRNYSGSLEQQSARAAGQTSQGWFRCVWVSLILLLLLCVALLLEWDSALGKRGQKS